MQPGPLPAELIAAAPDISGRLGRILMALAALVASAFLRDPRHVGVINPLWRYITRIARRFDSAFTRLAAGKQRPRSPRPAGATPSAPQTPRPRVRLPNHRAWLTVALKHHGAGHAYRLEHLLSEPETVALIAACPQVARLLRPLCHMLGISPAAIQPPPRPPRRVGCPSATHHVPAPAEREAYPAHPPSPLLAGPARPALPPLYPGYPPPPCEHVTWWPWYPPKSECIA